MVNEIRDDNQQLVPVHYSDLLDQIITTLQNQNTQNPFQLSSDGKRLIIKLSAIAQSVATPSITNPLGNQTKQAKVASVNFRSSSKQQFTEQIQQIRDSLTPYLETALSQYQNSPSIQEWVNQVATELNNFTGKCSNYISLEYPFQQQESGLQKTKLTLTPTHPSQPRLQFHKLKISIEKAHQFHNLLKNSLKNYIELQFSEEEQEELQEILDNLVNYEQSDFHRLEKLIDQEALGKIQREAKIIYLEFLKEQIGQTPNLIYIEDLIRRLRLLEDYINDEEKEDGHYQVNYQGITINYRDLFSRADAFEMLPIIPLIEGCLGETEDQNNDKKQFIFGLKLKLNGLVQGEKDAFNYYLELLDPDQEGIINEKHREIIRKWSLFFLEKSFLSGLNLFPEYLQATGWDKPNKLRQLKIVYYQCCFSDDNSLGTYPKGKEKANQDVISQFRDITVDLNHYSQKGEFLNADTLVLLRCGEEWRILCLDYSIFSIQSIRDLADLDSMEVLRNLLLKEVSYLKSKSVFANLGLDTQQTSFDLSESLKRYYLAFKTRDKETIKLIQAGSYVNSFSRFLWDQGIISGETNLTYNILGKARSRC